MKPSHRLSFFSFYKISSVIFAFHIVMGSVWLYSNKISIKRRSEKCRILSCNSALMSAIIRMQFFSSNIILDSPFSFSLSRLRESLLNPKAATVSFACFESRVYSITFLSLSLSPLLPPPPLALLFHLSISAPSPCKPHPFFITFFFLFFLFQPQLLNPPSTSSSSSSFSSSF